MSSITAAAWRAGIEEWMDGWKNGKTEDADEPCGLCINSFAAKEFPNEGDPYVY
jgi:hypothetical protein